MLETRNRPNPGHTLDWFSIDCQVESAQDHFPPKQEKPTRFEMKFNVVKLYLLFVLKRLITFFN